MKKLQQEHREWLAKTFSDQPKWLPAAGMVEEAGELLQSRLKSFREGQWGKEDRYKHVSWREEFIDAIGDCGIYICSLCNAMAWDFEYILNEPSAPVTGMTPIELAVELILAAANNSANPREFYVRRYVSILRGLCYIEGLDLEECIQTTWQLVKVRKK